MPNLKEAKQDFYWWKPFSGFIWNSADNHGHIEESEEDSQEFVLVARNDELKNTGREHVTIIRPIELQNDLFLEFASTDLSPSGALGFANRFGPLTCSIGHQGMFREALRDHTAKSLLNWQEPWSMWREELERARKAVLLLELIQGSKQSEIDKHIVWLKASDPTWVGFIERPQTPKKPSRQYHKSQIIEPIVSLSKEPEIFESFKDRNPVAPAQYLLMNLINEGLQARLPGGLRHGTLSREFIWDVKEKLPVTVFQHDSLLGLIWFQFAEAVQVGMKFQTCKNCGEVFGLTHKTNRSSRQYCSDACKTNACRQRESKAIKMHSNGKTPEQIAKDLGSDLATIEKWLSKRRK